MDSVTQLKILGDSQTLLGVLATLNVLCLFLDKDGNFILSLIKVLNDAFIARLQRIEQSINKRVGEFLNSENYTSIEIAASDNPDVEIKEKAQQLLFDTAVNKVNINTQIADSYKPIESISKYREQVLAPLYCFGFTLLLFVIDQIGPFFKSSFTIAYFLVNVFTIISLIYWAVLWISFIVHSAHEHDKDDGDTLLQKIDRFFTKPGSAALQFMISMAIYWLLILKLPWTELNEWGLTVFQILSFSIPIAILGIFRMAKSKIKGYFSYLHALGHLLAILIYSFGIAIIYHCFFPDSLYGNGILFDGQWMRIFVVLFLILNGIILPFACPFYRCSQILNTEKKKLGERQENIDNTIMSFTDQYETMCKDLGKQRLKASSDKKA